MCIRLQNKTIRCVYVPAQMKIHCSKLLKWKSCLYSNIFISGVGKRIVKFLMEEKKSKIRLSSTQINLVNQQFKSISLPPG